MASNSNKSAVFTTYHVCHGHFADAHTIYISLITAFLTQKVAISGLLDGTVDWIR